MRKYFAFLVAISAIFTSCSNDFRLTEEWKDITIIYGLLNPQDTAHYVRVEKAFLSEEVGPLDIAQIPDSLYYPVNDITVELWDVRLNTMVDVMERVEVRDEHIPVEAGGIFVDSPKYVYKSIAPLNSGDPNDAYRIVVRKVADNSEVIAETGIISQFDVTTPNNLNRVLSFRYGGGETTKIKWEKAENAGFYDLRLMLKFRELSPGGSFEDKSIIWYAGRRISQPGGNSAPEHDVRGQNFFTSIAGILTPPPAGTTRTVQSMEIYVDAGGPDLLSYLLARETYQGVTGGFNPPLLYSNVVPGLGVLSARGTTVFYSVSLSGQTLDSLALGMYTKNLGFQN